MTRSRAEDWASLWKVAPFLRALAGAARYEYLVSFSLETQLFCFPCLF